LALGLVEVLQCDHRTGVGIDAKHVMIPHSDFCRSVSGAAAAFCSKDILSPTELGNAHAAQPPASG